MLYIYSSWRGFALKRNNITLLITFLKWPHIKVTYYVNLKLTEVEFQIKRSFLREASQEKLLKGSFPRKASQEKLPKESFQIEAS